MCPASNSVNLAELVINETMKSICNHFQNILRLFDALPNFLLTTSKTMRDYYL